MNPSSFLFRSYWVSRTGDFSPGPAAGPLHIIRFLPLLLALIFLTITIRFWLGISSFLNPAPDIRSSVVIVQSTGKQDGSTSHQQQSDSPEFISPVFTPEVQSWADSIMRWSHIYNINPDLIATIMQIESCGHPNIRSGSGAIGLFQVMPFHFVQGDDPNNPATNALRGLVYLSGSLELSHGQFDLALAGYNGGHGLISRGVDEWPDETRRYVYWGSGIIQDIERGLSTSPHLEAWLNAGGASLCERASTALLLNPQVVNQ